MACLVFAVLCLLAGPAAGWIETDVRSHRAVITVLPDGKAEVRHELVLKVRGGPLQTLDVEGVGQDVEVLGDGTVRPSTSGSAHLWPLNLQVGDDGMLQVGIGVDRGLRGGVYRFDFGYQLDLFERNWLERKRDRARLTWVGPRFSSGIDSAKVVFRVPRSESQPSLPTEDGPASAVLLSEVRRGAEIDEIELVRAHVARGEPAVWQLDVSASAFPALRSDEPVTVGSMSVPVPHRALLLPRTSWWIWSLGGMLALLYGALLSLKWRAVRRQCTKVGVAPRALIPLPPWLRIPGAAVLLGAGAGFGLAEWPTVAGACLAGALLLATLLPPLRVPKARGPGEWLCLSEEKLQAPHNPSEGRWLDASTGRGASLLTGLTMITCGGAWWLLSSAPYQSGLVFLSLAAWLPLFVTGRAADMPADPAWGALPLYRWLSKKLSRYPEVRVEVWARRPLSSATSNHAGLEAGVDAGALASEVSRSSAEVYGRACAASTYDEMRLRLCFENALRGLRVVEVGIEIGGGMVAMPCVVIRVDDDSPAYRALPHSVHWVRGRRAEERVTVLRPRMPSRGQCLQLVLGTMRLLTRVPKAPQADSGLGQQQSVLHPAVGRPA